MIKSEKPRRYIMDIIKNNWKLILSVLLLFTGLIFLLGPRYIKYLNSRRAKDLPRIPVDFKSDGFSSPDFIKGKTTTTVVPEEKYDGPAVHFSGEKFYPKTVRLEQNASGIGCLLKIFNDGSKPLTVRLGPYEMSVKNNYGSQYPPIPSGKYMIIDPRFGRQREEFLDFEHSERKFSAEIDSSCLPAQ